MALIEMVGHNRSIVVKCCSKATLFLRKWPVNSKWNLCLFQRSWAQY